jgi:hypothetical protein
MVAPGTAVSCGCNSEAAAVLRDVRVVDAYLGAVA